MSTSPLSAGAAENDRRVAVNEPGPIAAAGCFDVALEHQAAIAAYALDLRGRGKYSGSLLPMAAYGRQIPVAFLNRVASATGC